MNFDPEQHPCIRVTDDGCWLWTGATTDGGYGRAPVARSQVVAHAVFYVAFVGPAPKGSQLHHRCGREPCVNPAHIEPLSGRSHRSRHRQPRTHCPRGHAYTDHGYEDKSGRLRCRLCTRETQRAWREKDRATRRYRCTCGKTGRHAVFTTGTALMRCPACGRRGGRAIRRLG